MIKRIYKMKHYIRSTRTVPALLIAAVAITIGIGTPLPAHAVAEQAAGQAAAQANDKSQQARDEDNRKKIREANDLKLKAQEPLYAEQAKSLAEQYRETAQIVARQGGNPQPLLDAAAHFENQSEVISKARQNPVSIQIPQPVAHPKVHK
jgi:hypothetical protein